jgi:hypothetical protein
MQVKQLARKRQLAIGSWQLAIRKETRKRRNGEEERKLTGAKYSALSFGWCLRLAAGAAWEVTWRVEIKNE